MSNILITGGAGFVGHFLARRLSDDRVNLVTVVDNLSRGRLSPEVLDVFERENVRFVQGDLTDPRLFMQLSKDFDYIYHLAAVIGVKHVMGNPDKVLYANAVSTLNVFEYAKGIKNISRVYFSSTSEVYAGTLRHFGIPIPTPEDVILTVEDVFSNRTTYAISKIYGELTAFMYAKKYGIPVTVGRYHNVYGPMMGFAHVIPETFVKVSKGGAIDVPSPGHTRAFCYIDDAVEMTIRACAAPEAAGEILNIGNSREEISVRDLVSNIAGVMGREVVIRELPDTPGSPSRRCPDTSKAERLTGYRPAVPLKEGLSRTYGWYKDRLHDKYE